MTETAEILIVGAGIAGASAAYELSLKHRVILIEREEQPGYHSTGRSVAIFSETYGPLPIKALSRASRPFYERPPAGFAGVPLLSPRGVLFVARADQLDALAAAEAEGGPFVERVAPAAARDLVPVLRAGYPAGAFLEPAARDIDVHALHGGYLAAFRRNGGRLATRAEAIAIARTGGIWRVETRQGAFEGEILVNAAGAWGDEVAKLAGAAPLGLVAKRRTAFVFDAPAGVDPRRWPMVIDAGEEFYFKPDAGRLIGSPGDATPVEPQDVQPEELDLATAAWRIEQATTLAIGAIGRRWAGLRSFLADGSPAIGFDPDIAGFFWLVGQGGYGIQSAPAAGKLAAALITGRSTDELAAQGVDAASLDPARLRRKAGAG